jgi:crotonobetainyl-CoA:carnitine CoA-transferase CaiB-like acyl-CoA transferase
MHARHREFFEMPNLPLSGLTVVELGHSVAAPYAGLVLAELGADVIKVERPDGGDPTRDWGPPFTDGVATAFHAYNRSKRSIVIDLRDERQRSKLLSLIETSGDIVLQNLRAGVADRLGLGAHALRERKPSLIYCNMHAFGAKGPLRDRPGYDPLMQAFGGLMSVTGESHERPPVRIGVSIVDMGAGMWAVIGILAALAELQRSGRGCVVDVSLFETALGWMMWPLTSYLASGIIPQREGSGTTSIVPYQAFKTLDSYIMIAAGNDRLFEKLCGVIQRADLAGDPRFATNSARVENRKILLPILQAAFADRTAFAWTEVLAAAGVPASPLQDVRQVADDAQTTALGILQRAQSSEFQSVGLPLSFDGIRPGIRGPAPKTSGDIDHLGREGELR